MVKTSDILLLYAAIKALSSSTNKLNQEIAKRNYDIEKQNFELKKQVAQVQREKISDQFKQQYEQIQKTYTDSMAKAALLYDQREKLVKSKAFKNEQGLLAWEEGSLHEQASGLAVASRQESESAQRILADNVKVFNQERALAIGGVSDPTEPTLPSGKSGSGGANIAIAVAAAVANELKQLFDKFMAPGQELSKELKTAGLPSMVKAFNTVADPLIDMAEIISDSISPAFIPMIEKLAEGMGGLLQPIEGNAEGLSKMDVLVRDITPVMTSAGDALVQLVPQIPSMITLWVKFAAVNWEGIATFMINNGDKILFVLERTVTILDNIYSALNGINDFTLPKLLIGNERSFGGAGNYYGRDT
jgi:hypothetical protein